MCISAEQQTGKVLEAQRFKCEEALNGAVKKLIYVCMYTYTFFAASATHTHENADSTDTLAITSKIDYIQ